MFMLLLSMINQDVNVNFLRRSTEVLFFYSGVYFVLLYFWKCNQSQWISALHWLSAFIVNVSLNKKNWILEGIESEVELKWGLNQRVEIENLIAVDFWIYFDREQNCKLKSLRQSWRTRFLEFVSLSSKYKLCEEERSMLSNYEFGMMQTKNVNNSISPPSFPSRFIRAEITNSSISKLFANSTLQKLHNSKKCEMKWRRRFLPQLHSTRRNIIFFAVSILLSSTQQFDST